MLNIHGIIDHCCGIANPAEHPYTDKMAYLAKQFKTHKLTEIKPASIQKWLERKQIPGDRLVELHILAKKQGKRLDLYDFLAKPSKVDKVKAFFG